MAAPATGTVLVKKRTGGRGVRDPLPRLRPRRRYVTLGSEAEGWTPAKAEESLRHALADVERGIWQPPRPEPVPSPARTPDPTFYQFSADWLQANEGGCAPRRPRQDYAWQLDSHLLPFFGRHRLSQVSIAEVDRYRALKVREGRLSPRRRSTRRSRAWRRYSSSAERARPAPAPQPDARQRRATASSRATQASAAVWLDRADQIDHAARGRRRARPPRSVPDRRHVPRRAMLAALAFGWPAARRAARAPLATIWTSPPVDSGLPVLPTRTATDALRPTPACRSRGSCCPPLQRRAWRPIEAGPRATPQPERADVPHHHRPSGSAATTSATASSPRP